jgi:hypothetical protein
MHFYYKVVLLTLLSFTEMADIYFILGEVNGNTSRTMCQEG